MVHMDDIYSWNVPYHVILSFSKKASTLTYLLLISVTILAVNCKKYLTLYIFLSVTFSEQKNSQIRHIAGRLKWTDPLGGIYLIIMNPVANVSHPRSHRVVEFVARASRRTNDHADVSSVEMIVR